MIKRMPFFYFTFTFLLCGSVIGALSGSYVTMLDVSSGILLPSSNIFLIALWDVLKFNLPNIILGKVFGFLIPVIILIRGFILSFAFSAIYYNTQNIFDTTVIIQSFLNNLIAIPCFLIISSCSLDSFFKKSKNRRKGIIQGNSIILICILLNFLWNLFCQIIF